MSKENEPYNLPPAEDKFLTEQEVRAIVSSSQENFSGNFRIKSGSVKADGGTIEAGSGNSIFKVKDGLGIWLGHADYSSAPFKVSLAGALVATSVDIAGKITADEGKIANWNIGTDTIYSDDNKIVLDSANQRIEVGASAPIIIDGANKRIRSDNYVSGYAGSGFNLDPDLLEVGNIACRGIFRSAVLQYDNTFAYGGNQIVSKGADVLKTTMTAADNSTVEIENDSSASAWAVGDILKMDDANDVEWFEITSVAGNVYTCNRDKKGDYGAGANPAWKEGAAVMNYGQSGDGGVYTTASEANAPYLSIFTHAGSPWTDLVTRLRIGNLNGYLGYTTDKYGIGIGDSTHYLKYDPTGGLVMEGGTIQTSASGRRIVLGSVNHDLLLYNSSGESLLDLGSESARILGIVAKTDVQSLYISTTVAKTATDHIYFNINNASATKDTLNLGQAGTGYCLYANPINNVSRVKASAYFGAVSGQGANINLFPIANAPQTPSEGDLYADTDHYLYYYNGSSFDKINKKAGIETYIAGEDISNTKTVYLKNSDGEVYLTDANYFGEKRMNFIGFADETITNGNSIKIQTMGNKSGFSFDLTPAGSGTDQQHPSYTADDRVKVLSLGTMFSQGFRVGDKTGNISSVTLMLGKVGSPTKNLCVAIRAMDTDGGAGAGKPTGADLEVGSISMSSLGAFAEHIITLDSVLSVSPGDKYCIVVYAEDSAGTLDVSNYVKIGINDTNHGCYFFAEQPQHIYYETTDGTIWNGFYKSFYFKTNYTEKKHLVGDSVYLSTSAGEVSLDYVSDYPFIIGKLISSSIIEINSELKERYNGKTVTFSNNTGYGTKECSVGIPPRTRKIIIKGGMDSIFTKQDIILTKEKTLAYIQEDTGIDATVTYEWTGNRIKMTSSNDNYSGFGLAYFYT